MKPRPSKWNLESTLRHFNNTAIPPENRYIFAGKSAGAEIYIFQMGSESS